MPRVHSASYVTSEAACNRQEASNTPGVSAASSQPRDGALGGQQAPVYKGPPLRVKAPGRIIALGDIHGDLHKTLASLELAGVLGRDGNGRPRWTGGNTTLVQMGDVLDRGDCEIGVLLLLRELDRQAREVQGAVWMLNGNHESLNVAGDFRYVTPGAFWECAAVAGLSEADMVRDSRAALRARWELYRPGGRLACDLSANPTVLIVNDIVFAHGGLLPHHLAYGLEKINAEVSAWMSAGKGWGAGIVSGLRYDDDDDDTDRAQRDEADSPPLPPFLAMGDGSSIMWNRTYGREHLEHGDRARMREQLECTLRALQARALVVGHTPQSSGLNSECGGRVWRVDVGMSAGVLDADPAVLELAPADEQGVVVATARRAPRRRVPGSGPVPPQERSWRIEPLGSLAAAPMHHIASKL